MFSCYIYKNYRFKQSDLKTLITFDFMEQKQVFLCLESWWCDVHFVNTASQIWPLNHGVFSYKPIMCEGEFK